MREPVISSKIISVKKISSEKITIHAPIEKVWAILLDLPRYPEWNPFTYRVESSLVIGAPVDLYVRMRKRGERMQQEYVRTVEAPTRLAWGMTMGHATLLTALREQKLERIDRNSCIYHTTDAFSGVLTPLVMYLFGDDIEHGFNAVARALKVYAEKG